MSMNSNIFTKAQTRNENTDFDNAFFLKLELHFIDLKSLSMRALLENEDI